MDPRLKETECANTKKENIVVSICSKKEWKTMIDVNFTGTLFCARLNVPQGKGGRMVPLTAAADEQEAR